MQDDSMIYQIPWIRWIHWISVPFREISNVVIPIINTPIDAGTVADAGCKHIFRYDPKYHFPRLYLN